MASKKKWKARAQALEARVVVLEQGRAELEREALYHREKHAQLLAWKQPVVTDEQTKADIEAAYVRGLESGRTNHAPAGIRPARLLPALQALAVAEEAVKDASAQFAVALEEPKPEEEPLLAGLIPYLEMPARHEYVPSDGPTRWSAGECCGKPEGDEVHDVEEMGS